MTRAGVTMQSDIEPDEIETLASVTLSDVNGALRAMLCTERSATVIIRPAQ